MKSVSTRLDDETYRRIDETAKEKGVSKVEALRELVEKVCSMTSYNGRGIDSGPRSGR